MRPESLGQDCSLDILSISFPRTRETEQVGFPLGFGKTLVFIVLVSGKAQGKKSNLVQTTVSLYHRIRAGCRNSH